VYGNCTDSRVLDKTPIYSLIYTARQLFSGQERLYHSSRSLVSIMTSIITDLSPLINQSSTPLYKPLKRASRQPTQCSKFPKYRTQYRKRYLTTRQNLEDKCPLPVSTMPNDFLKAISPIVSKPNQRNYSLASTTEPAWALMARTGELDV
jgi:hypothetical protein